MLRRINLRSKLLGFASAPALFLAYYLIISICCMARPTSTAAAFIPCRQPKICMPNLCISQNRQSPPVDIILLQQQSSSSQAEPSSCVVERLDLNEQFNRWRLLQQLLEAEADASDVNEVLYRVLKSFLDYPRPSRIVDGNGISRSNSSPIITQEKRQIIESLLGIATDDSMSNDNGIVPIQGTIPVFIEPDCTPNDTSALEGVERLLPDPLDEEDAHKTCWDIVMEMYGKEAVKAEEMDRSEEWRARCSVVRMLIHYDFLDEIVDGST